MALASCATRALLTHRETQYNLYENFIRGRGGTGRRARFRFWWLYGCGSSSLPDRTLKALFLQGFFLVRRWPRSAVGWVTELPTTQVSLPSRKHPKCNQTRNLVRVNEQTRFGVGLPLRKANPG